MLSRTVSDILQENVLTEDSRANKDIGRARNVQISRAVENGLSEAFLSVFSVCKERCSCSMTNIKYRADD